MEAAVASTAGSGSEGFGVWAVEKFTNAASAAGMRLDLNVSIQEKALAVVKAQRNAMIDRKTVMVFAGASMLLLALAAMGKGRALTNKLISIMFSGLWASMALQVLGNMVETSQQGGLVGWPVEAVATAVVLGAQSVIFAVVGGSGLIAFGFPCGSFASRPSHQIGFAHLVATLAAVAINANTKGTFFKYAFPLDLFTIGVVLGSAQPSGYSKMALHLPIACALARSWFDIIVLADFEHAFVPIITLIACHNYSRWAQPSDSYRWVAPELRPDAPQARQRRERPPPKPQPPPLMQETRGGEDGGVQGMGFVRGMEMVDEDGDEAMEFFEVTDEGLKKRNPVGKAIDS